jgi:dTDP-glucose 4,6-dehydratase
MKVLVTGGAGFIGSNFVRMVADGRLPGYSEVTVLDKLT